MFSQQRHLLGHQVGQRSGRVGQPRVVGRPPTPARSHPNSWNAGCSICACEVASGRPAAGDRGAPDPAGHPGDQRGGAHCPGCALTSGRDGSGSWGERAPAAVDEDRHAVDVRRVVGGEEQRYAGQLLDGADPLSPGVQGQPLEHPRPRRLPNGWLAGPRRTRCCRRTACRRGRARRCSPRRGWRGALRPGRRRPRVGRGGRTPPAVTPSLGERRRRCRRRSPRHRPRRSAARTPVPRHEPRRDHADPAEPQAIGGRSHGCQCGPNVMGDTRTAPETTTSLHATPLGGRGNPLPGMPTVPPIT